MKQILAVIAVLLLGLFTTSCGRDPTAPIEGVNGTSTDPASALDRVPKLHVSGSVTVFASGFNAPSGLTFGPDGYLYVAEAGCGGTSLMGPEANAVKSPIGPYTGGMTARISKVSLAGVRSTVVEGLPSSQSSRQNGCRFRGVADVEFVGSTLYALVCGAGPSHGFAGIPNSIIRVDGMFNWKVVANLSQYLGMHPIAKPDPYDIEPDGIWHSMAKVQDRLIAVEPNHGELDEIDPMTGEVRRIVDISSTQGHIDPSAVVYRAGYFYVGNLTTPPEVDGRAAIYRISPTGEVVQWAAGFTDINGLAFDERGRLYVLEGRTSQGGTIVRINLGGWRETIVTGLSLPTAFAFGPDRALYVANRGYGQGMVGCGEILRITGESINPF